MKKLAYLIVVLIIVVGVPVLAQQWSNRTSQNTDTQNNSQNDQAAPKQQTKSTTPDCKNYKNFGIELSCPEGYEMHQFEAGDTVKYQDVVNLSFFDKNKPLHQEGSLFYNAFIGIYKDSYAASLENYISDPDLHTMKLQGQKTIGGKTAHSLVCAAPEIGCQNIDLVFNEGMVYEFINGDSSAIAGYNSLLSSVRFY